MMMAPRLKKSLPGAVCKVGKNQGEEGKRIPQMGNKYKRVIINKVL